MKSKIINTISIVISLNFFAQVGINIENPQSTLDVNGNTIIRTVPETTSLSDYKILLLNQNNSEVSQIDPSLIKPGTSQDTEATSTVYSAKKNSDISLLGANLFSTWKKINFVETDRTIGSPSLFSNPDNSYIVPSDGIYAIGFYFCYGSGLQSFLITGGSGIGILKNTNSSFSTLETRNFNGVNLGVLALTISEISINSVYKLNADDKIYFGLKNTGTLGVDLLSTSSSSFYIYKISN